MHPRYVVGFCSTTVSVTSTILSQTTPSPATLDRIALRYRRLRQHQAQFYYPTQHRSRPIAIMPSDSHKKSASSDTAILDDILMTNVEDPPSAATLLESSAHPSTSEPSPHSPGQFPPASSTGTDFATASAPRKGSDPASSSRKQSQSTRIVEQAAAMAIRRQPLHDPPPTSPQATRNLHHNALPSVQPLLLVPPVASLRPTDLLRYRLMMALLLQRGIRQLLQ